MDPRREERDEDAAAIAGEESGGGSVSCAMRAGSGVSPEGIGLVVLVKRYDGSSGGGNGLVLRWVTVAAGVFSGS